MSLYGPTVSSLDQPGLPPGTLESDVTAIVIRALPRVGFWTRLRLLWALARGRVLDLTMRDLARAMHAAGTKHRLVSRPIPVAPPPAPA